MDSLGNSLLASTLPASSPDSHDLPPVRPPGARTGSQRWPSMSTRLLARRAAETGVSETAPGGTLAADLS